MEGLWPGPLGRFHAASRVLSYLKIVQELLKATFGFNGWDCLKYCREEAVLCSSTVVIPGDTKRVPPMFCE